MKAFAEENVAKMTISVLDSVENIVDKRRKCWLPAFSPSPTINFYQSSPKSWDCVVNGNPFSYHYKKCYTHGSNYGTCFLTRNIVGKAQYTGYKDYLQIC